MIEAVQINNEEETFRQAEVADGRQFHNLQAKIDFLC